MTILPNIQQKHTGGASRILQTGSRLPDLTKTLRDGYTVPLDELMKRIMAGESKESIESESYVTHCKASVHMAYVLWGNIGCQSDLAALAGETPKSKKLLYEEFHLKYPGTSPHGYKSEVGDVGLNELANTMAVDMAYAGKSLEDTQQTVLKFCQPFKDAANKYDFGPEKEKGNRVRW